MNKKLFEKLHANRVLPDIINAKDGDVPTISINAYEGVEPVVGDWLTKVSIDVNKVVNTDILQELIDSGYGRICKVKNNDDTIYYLGLDYSTFVDGAYQIIICENWDTFGDSGWLVNPTDEELSNPDMELSIPAHSALRVYNGNPANTVNSGISEITIPEGLAEIQTPEYSVLRWDQVKDFISINGYFKPIDAEINWGSGSLPSLENAKDGQVLKVTKKGGKDSSFLDDWSKSIDKLYFDTNMTAEHIRSLDISEYGYGTMLHLTFKFDNYEEGSGYPEEFNISLSTFSGRVFIEGTVVFSEQDGWNTEEMLETDGHYYVPLPTSAHIENIYVEEEE